MQLNKIDDSKKLTINQYLGYDGEDSILEDNGYQFYERQMKNGLTLVDADRYAHFNTVLNYDIGINTFRCLQTFAQDHNFEILQIETGEKSKEQLQGFLESFTKITDIKIDMENITEFNRKQGYHYFN